MTNEKELREQLKNHICRFNDFPQECECFKAGFHSHTKEVVAEKIKGMKRGKYEEWVDGSLEDTSRHYNQALDDLLASLEDNKK